MVHGCGYSESLTQMPSCMFMLNYIGKDTIIISEV